MADREAREEARRRQQRDNYHSRRQSAARGHRPTNPPPPEVPLPPWDPRASNQPAFPRAAPSWEEWSPQEPPQVAAETLRLRELRERRVAGQRVNAPPPQGTLPSWDQRVRSTSGARTDPGYPSAVASSSQPRDGSPRREISQSPSLSRYNPVASSSREAYWPSSEPRPRGQTPQSLSSGSGLHSPHLSEEEDRSRYRERTSSRGRQERRTRSPDRRGPSRGPRPPGNSGRDPYY
ncbi:hypothetical protein MMC09_004173 [Bachmanniomyces sp. S44760]|nr:hypothetical protein [Bachmanniomyces sp. S44760]